jgi:hypothetical protein
MKYDEKKQQQSMAPAFGGLLTGSYRKVAPAPDEQKQIFAKCESGVVEQFDVDNALDD